MLTETREPLRDRSPRPEPVEGPSTGSGSGGLTIGSITVPTPVVLAPMAGVTNAAYRQLCREQGAGLYVCEMITSRGVVARDRKTSAMLQFDPGETVRSVQLYGVDLTHRSFDERRATLERLVLPEHVQLSPVYPDGADLWAVTLEHGLEGVLAKRRTSTYQPGRRSPDWIKVAHRTTRTALVGGWRVETTARDRIGALLLGGLDAEGRLRFLGRAGSGLGGALAHRLAPLLTPLERPTSPFGEPVPAVDARDAHWCEPTVKVDITYLTRMRSGRMRQPVVRGVRHDADVDPWEDL